MTSEYLGTTEDLGDIRPTGDSYELVFERTFPRPIEKVWAALTIPERIADWLANAEIDLRVGGRIALHWTDSEPHYRMEGRIVALEPPRLIAWTWPDDKHPASVVRWELEPVAEGCRLRLTQSGLRPPSLLDIAAGWHTYLECLPGGADGVTTPWKPDREAAIYKRYEAVTLEGQS